MRRPSGTILKGQVHEGATGTAGELGHVVVAPDGYVCRCGNRAEVLGAIALAHRETPAHVLPGATPAGALPGAVPGAVREHAR